MVTVGATYRAVWKYKLQSRVWNIILLILFIFSWMMPIKMNPTTNTVNYQADRAIATSKVLPPKQVDDSFKQSVNAVQSISKEELK